MTALHKADFAAAARRLFIFSTLVDDEDELRDGLRIHMLIEGELELRCAGATLHANANGEAEEAVVHGSTDRCGAAGKLGGGA